jgi:hypothetical protein
MLALLLTASLSAWLPAFANSSAFWDDAVHISQRDEFSYIGANGTSFVVGPARGRVVYDYTHHIALYHVGCCAWGDVVLGYASLPPERVVNRDLTALHTVRGIRLGMSPGGVTLRYGANTLRRVPRAKDVYVLAYTTWPPKSQMIGITRSPCGQFQNFYFRNDRLVLIQLGNGC